MDMRVTVRAAALQYIGDVGAVNVSASAQLLAPIEAERVADGVNFVEPLLLRALVAALEPLAAVRVLDSA